MVEIKQYYKLNKTCMYIHKNGVKSKQQNCITHLTFVAKTNKGVSTGRYFQIPGDQTICSYFHVIFVADGVLADPVMRQDGKSEALIIHRDWRTLLTLWFLAL